MENVFNHSVKLPSQYRAAIKIARKFINEKASVKSLMYNEKHARVNRLNGLLDKFFRNRDLIDKVIEQSEILKNEPRFDQFACRILVTELLMGHEKGLVGQSKPIQTILTYRDKLFEAFNELNGSTEIKNKIQLPRLVRINTLKITIEEALEECRREGFQQLTQPLETYSDFLDVIKNLDEYEFIVDFHIKYCLVFSSRTRYYWANSPLVAEDKFILQDKASCLAPTFLLLPRKSCVLDMCAAPGMKTTQMAAIMKNKGLIYANDFNKERYQQLCENVKSKNAKGVTLINRDACELTGDDYPHVEYILLDPPCSGSGMTNRYGDTNRDRTRIINLARLQTKFLVHTLQSFPNVKRVVYSTCSIYPEENEQVVEKAVKRCPNFKLVDLNDTLEKGKQWNNFGSPDYKDIGERCIYSYEEKDFALGFFCAVFENVNLNEDGTLNKTVKIELNDESNRELNDNQENIENGGEITELHDGEPMKKKKKKNKHIDAADHSEVIEAITIMEVEDAPKKKKKKRKDIENGDGIVEDDEVKETVAVNEEPAIKSKKKKKHREDEKNTNELQVPDENNPVIETESEDITKKKKKKKKYTDIEDGHEVVKVNKVQETLVENEVQTIKPKKKKKHGDIESNTNEVQITDENNPVTEIESEAITKKKKKKRKHSTIEDLPMEETPQKKKDKTK